MIPLRTLLRVKGLVCADDLFNRCSPEALEELEIMVEEKEVSVHTEALGEKKYRYPAYQAKVVGDKPNKSNKVLEFIQANPGMNGSTLRKSLKISQSAFERMEGELLQDGKITRKKSGVSWIYSAGGVDAPAVENRPSGLYDVWFVYTGGLDLSIQRLAEEAMVSRESAAKCREWMIGHGMLEGHQLVGFWEKTVAERRKWLKEIFPEATELNLRSIPEMEVPASWKPVEAGGVLQSTTPAQPDESVPYGPAPDYSKTGKQVLTALGQGTLTVEELLAELPGFDRQTLKAKLQRLVKGEQVGYDESEDPTVFFRV